jgi:hypothetical protein
MRFKNITVEPLLLRQSDLNTKRMLDLMAVSSDDGPMPLYLHTVYRVLREMRMEQQETGGTFDYYKFKTTILNAGITPQQLGPLEQRLDTLESFMTKSDTGPPILQKKGKKKQVLGGTSWDLQVWR